MSAIVDQQRVAILIFNGVEVLDFAGPFEVFSVAGQRSGTDPFQVYTVAETLAPVMARNQLSVNPHYSFETSPQPDIVVIPGGGGYRPDGTPYGTRREMENLILLRWIDQIHQPGQQLLSVCTGALILAQLGWLDGLGATTHQGAMAQLAQIAPNTRIYPDARIVDNGSIVLSGGISAGIDMALYVVAQLLGQDQAMEAASYMEYDWRPEELRVVTGGD
jgi:transcriptional regulator GlxA family with amidase domain